MASNVAPLPRRSNSGPSAGRAIGAAALFAVVWLFGLAVFPGILDLVLCLGGPAAAALAFSGPEATRDRFSLNGIAASLTSGAIGAIWIGANGDDDTATAAIAVGAVVSFVLLTVFGALVCYVVSRRLPEGER